MGMASNVRVNVIYEGVDISQEIQNAISSLEYTDNSKNAVDDLEIELENLDYRWLHEWYPDENAKLIVKILQTDNGTDRVLHLGSFYVDEPTFDNQKMTLKLIALPLNQNIRDQKNSVAWEQITLKNLVLQIANKHGMNAELHCEDEIFERLDQDRETDLGFLKRIVEEVALNLKIIDNKIVIFDEEEMLSNDTIVVFNIRDPRIKSFSLRKKNQNVYDKVEVSYYDADKKQHIREVITRKDLEKRNEVTV